MVLESLFGEVLSEVVREGMGSSTMRTDSQSHGYTASQSHGYTASQSHGYTASLWLAVCFKI